MPRLTKATQQFLWSCVFCLHNLYTTWSSYKIAKFIHSSDHLELRQSTFECIKKATQRCLQRILNTGSVKRLSGQGRKRSVQTEENIRAVVNVAKNSKVSANKTAQRLNMSSRSVRRILKSSNLKPYHSRRTSRITVNHTQARLRFSRYLLNKYGHNPLINRGIELTRIVNTDFSQKFKLFPLPNTKNRVIWSSSRQEADDAGALVGIEKYCPSVMLWGGISWRGLIPNNAPLFVDDWLKLNFPQEPKTMTSDKYCVLLERIAKPSIDHIYPEGNAIYQDDGASIHRTPGSLNKVNELFNRRVDVKYQAAKCDDLWPIENVWGIIKERLALETFSNLAEMKTKISEIWQNISRRTRHRLISSIPKRCRKIVIKNGRRLLRENYLKEE